jgi:hypothetical protein
MLGGHEYARFKSFLLLISLIESVFFRADYFLPAVDSTPAVSWNLGAVYYMAICTSEGFFFDWKHLSYNMIVIWNANILSYMIVIRNAYICQL